MSKMMRSAAAAFEAVGVEGIRRMPKSAKKPAPKPARRSNMLVGRLKPNQTPEEATAELAVAGLTSNAITAREWSTFSFGELDLTACLKAVVESTERVKRGDLGEAEALLMAQAVTLNALFTNLARRARVSQYGDHLERYLRLALKSQNQCRATIETLAVIKNPPTLFARQANIAHGPQQVNNTAVVSPEGRDALRARAGSQKTRPNELLEAHGERLDLGAAGTAGAGDQTLAPVGAGNRPAHG